ncbi:MAG: ParA family protein [Ruminococcaceae bacterium]|nr:ParA family protein [Oscillospiraceae bacterium]
MGKIISVVNQKGGVGKTTSAVNLAAGLGLLGKKILLLDIDPQGNTTSGYGIDRRNVKASSYDLLVGDKTVSDAAIATKFKNVTVVPSSMDLAGAEIELIDLDNRNEKLKQKLLPIRNDYDFILIDCPPSLGLITINALTVSDSVMVPIQCEYYALEGLSQLISSIRQVKRIYNPNLEVEGILLTMYDGRLNLTQQVVGEIKKYFKDKLYSTVIPRAVRLSEAPSYGEPIQYYDKHSKGADAYNNLAKEFLKKNKGWN